jgi:WhiB family redox-sensing transcriptional regulator
MNRDWRASAVCTGFSSELFFPDKGASGHALEAKIICRGCPVRAECLEWAMTNHEEFGIWGAMTREERRALRRRQRRAS